MSKAQRTILIGAGEAGQQVLREIQANPGLNICAVGFLDDDSTIQGKIIQNIPVLGKVDDIPEITKKHKIELIIICIPSAKSEQLNKITSLCAKTFVKTRIVPGLQEIINGQVKINHIREIKISDLLLRTEVNFDLESGKYVKGKKVLITGAGGSIGSELCRQLAELEPKELILLGKGENSIYLIHEELKQQYPKLSILPVIADIKDKSRMEYVFDRYKPSIIFHAAAHKHVPLMEDHASEAVINNIFGTLIVAKLASQYNVEIFVQISTDKAVNSTNIMGATKRVAELIIQNLSRQKTFTKYITVRFGNVLGSTGSVIPKFYKQIEQGGPITITHPEMTRYFMTIPEASQLVIQAGNLGAEGEVFVLDMGKPVKIVDLACQLIVLSGKIPDVDVKIEYTGLRPGEKIHEELFIKGENVNATCYEKIFAAKMPDINSDKLMLNVENLRKNAVLNNNIEIRRILQEDLQVLNCSATQPATYLTSSSVING